jgi:hypothetical protein
MQTAAVTTREPRQASPERWQRALQRAMLAGAQVRQLQGSGQWIVTSASDPGAAYETDGVGCTCPAALLEGKPVCLHRAPYWHAQGVLDVNGEPEPPAPAETVQLVESFRGGLDYLAVALRHIAAKVPRGAA